tara:strand:- start:299 stop:469 length:171 start_codon:yes stop_codon:yes gene_type:complete
MPPPLRAFGVAFFSALAGASVVHNYYAPDLSIPNTTTTTTTTTTGFTTKGGGERGK